jgi:hypothetical protein
VHKEAPVVKRTAAPKREQAAQEKINPEEVIPLDEKDFEGF